MKAGNFYYDWLMVYGGIFPTFPDPEHGRSVAEAVGVQRGEGERRRGDGVDVVQG